MIKAVVVGINSYKNFPSQNLSGCVNDANDVLDYLTKTRGASEAEITPLYDERATKHAIVDALHDMIASSLPGDQLLFHYSGHGAQIPAVDISEPDGLDEVLCPHDFAFGDRSSALVDDEIAAIFATVPDGVSLTLVADSCHSGDIDRELTKKASRGAPRRLKPPADLAWRMRAKKPLPRKRVRTIGNAVAVSACASGETAADTAFDKPNGAFTHYWLAALQAAPNAAVDQLVASTAKALVPYDMHPECDGSPDLCSAGFLTATDRRLTGAPHARTRRRALATTRSIVLYETQWSSTVMGLPVTLGLRVTQPGAGFTFELTPSVGGAKMVFPVQVDGNLSVPIPLSVLGQLLVDISNWSVVPLQLDCDIAVRFAPSLPLVPPVVIGKERLSIPLMPAQRAMTMPTSAAELQAMVELLRGALPQLLQPGTMPRSRDVTAADGTPFVAASGSFGWGPNWREDRPIMVGRLAHNQIRSGEPILFGQQGAGNVHFVRWLNPDPTDGSFIAHIGNNFFGGWGSISWQVMAVDANVDINLQPQRALVASTTADTKTNGAPRPTNGHADIVA
jgi:hypothetical protein